MVERDVALAKINLIERAISRIREIRQRREPLSSLDVEELTVLNLQRAAQASIDLAAHVVSSEEWRLPESLGENFTILAEQGVVSHELAANLRRMAGFRNVAVHTYETIDSSIVDEIVSNRLGDLVDLAKAIIERFGLDRGA